MTNRTQQVKRMIAKNALPSYFKKTTDSIWYSFLNDMVVYVVMECPSDLVYVWFCMFPLIMPPNDGPGHMVFGDRIMHHFQDLYNGVYTTDNDSNILKWCDKAKDHIQNELIPPLEKISTVKKMYEFWKNETNTRIPDFICEGNEAFATQLLMYAAIYLGKNKEANEFAERYLNYISHHWQYVFVEQIKNNEIANAKQMINDERYCKHVFEEWRWKNMVNYDRSLKK